MTARIHYHKFRGLKQCNLFSYSSGGQKSKISFNMLVGLHSLQRLYRRICFLYQILELHSLVHDPFLQLWRQHSRIFKSRYVSITTSSSASVSNPSLLHYNITFSSIIKSPSAFYLSSNFSRKVLFGDHPISLKDPSFIFNELGFHFWILIFIHLPRLNVGFIQILQIFFLDMRYPQTSCISFQIHWSIR